MRTRNNRMYQLDQVTLRERERERERERKEPGHWCVVKVRMRRGKSDNDDLWAKVIRS